MEQFLSSIGINDKGSFTYDGDYIIDFDSVDDYSRAFSRLDKSNKIEENDASTITNASISSIIYSNDDYIITLSADFDNDSYKLVMQEVGN